MRARSTVLIAVVVAACALGVAACGGDDETSGGATGSDAVATGSDTVSTGSQPSGTPIVIGTVCSCTGVQKSSLGGTETVIRAWEQSINESGGINGHPVEVIIKDDQSDPAKASTLVRELVDEDKVMAIVGYTSTLTPWAEYVASKGVPVIGGASYTEPSTTDPNFFPAGAPFTTGVFGIETRLKDLGADRIAVFPCAEAPVCAQTADLYKAIATVVGGVSVPYVSNITSTQPSFTAQCLGAKDADANAIFAVTDSATGIRVFTQCLQQGLTDIKAIGHSGASGYRQGPIAYGNNLVQFADTYPMVNNDTPATQEFHDAVNAYDPEFLESDLFNANNGSAWTALQLYKIVAEKAKLGPESTPADVKEGLYSLKEETVGGLTAPLTYTRGKPTFIPCYFLEETKDGGWDVPFQEPKCMTPKQQEEIFTALGA